MTSDAYRWRPEENLSPMDPRVNTQVKAVQRAEAIIRHAWVRLAAADAVLFDPALVPELAERVDVAAAEYHALAAEGALRYETHDGDADYNPDAMYEQGAGRQRQPNRTGGQPRSTDYLNQHHRRITRRRRTPRPWT